MRAPVVDAAPAAAAGCAGARDASPVLVEVVGEEQADIQCGADAFGAAHASAGSSVASSPPPPPALQTTATRSVDGRAARRFAVRCPDAARDTYRGEAAELRRKAELAKALLAEQRAAQLHLVPADGDGDGADADADAVRILYEDEDVLALDKPAGVYVGSLLPLAVQHCCKHGGGGDSDRLQPRLLHRLDRDTSGVVLFGKHAAATRYLGSALGRSDGSVRKRYWAALAPIASHVNRAPACLLSSLLLRPPPPPRRCGAGGAEDAAPGREIRVISGHGRSAHGLYRLYPTASIGHRVHSEMRKPVRRAETVFRYVGRATAAAAAATSTTTAVLLFACELVTGRTHQIRLHAHALDAPLVDDSRYGALAAQQPHHAPAYHALHAARVEFSSRLSRRPVRIDAPPPPWWWWSGSGSGSRRHGDG